ncbi:MAG: DegT/DnrJ/EryC1/StrS family aminotransferase [Candidatus Thioglobus sp.]|jgi:perosamine synthetase
MNYQMARPYFPEDEINWLLEEFKNILQGNAPLSMGSRVKEFEGTFANYVGADYAVGTNSCTAALEIALRSIGIQKGDEVIIPAETFIATGSAVVSEGATPVFCDINPKSFCIGLNELKKQVTEKTKAVIIVHMAGMISPDALKIKEYCQQENITLIEDAAHAIGASIQGVYAGNIGDISCFSFYPTKIMTTAEGGMLLCSDKDLFEKATSFRNRGRDINTQGEVYSRLGTNNRMTEFAALLGISQLKCLNNFLETRRMIARIYNEKIQVSDVSHLVQPIIVPEEINHSYWRYLITLDPSINREVIKEELAKDNIASDWAYYPALHLQPYFMQQYKTYKGLCPVAEDSLERNICLPINSIMQQEDAVFIVEKFIVAIKKSLCIK